MMKKKILLDSWFPTFYKLIYSDYQNPFLPDPSFCAEVLFHKRLLQYCKDYCKVITITLLNMVILVLNEIPHRLHHVVWKIIIFEGHISIILLVVLGFYH